MTDNPVSRRWLFAVLVAVVLTRLPLLFTGYGAEGDAWRVASVAHHLWQTGEYRISRPPGHPLHEILTAPLIALGGEHLSNAATLAAMLCLVLVWARMVERATRHPKLLVILLAFAPLLWRDSAGTIDYVWSLLFILLSLDAGRRNHFLLAGISLGLALGFRASNVVALVPLLVLLRIEGHPVRTLVRVSAIAAVTSILTFLPVLLTYNLSGWVEEIFFHMRTTQLPFAERMLIFSYRAVYAIGPFAAIAAMVMLIRGRKALRNDMRSRDPVVITALSALVVFILLFWLFPVKRDHLLPAIPFLFLLLDRVATRRSLAIFACCLLIYAFVNVDTVLHRGVRGSPQINVRWGLVVEEWQNRNDLREKRKRIAGITLPGKGVIMTGLGPVFWFDNQLVEPDTSRFWMELKEDVVHQRSNPDIHYIVLLDKSSLERIRENGYEVYCLGSMREFVVQKVSYRFDEAGVKLTPE